MQSFKRVDRVRNQMLRDVRVILDQECATRLSTLVTFTEVEMTGDLRNATIYYSVLGDDAARKRTASYLSRIRKRVKSQLGDMLQLKFTTEITFRFDPSIERGMKIEQLLNKIAKNDDERDDENS
jgi:ribosome-binding factor A